MAPGVCVTSFRMLLRRSDFAGQLSRGLRLTPAGTPMVNSWSTRARRFSTDKDKDPCPDDDKPVTGKSKTINEKASLYKEDPTKARSTQTAAAAAATTTTAAAAAAARLESDQNMHAPSQTPKKPPSHEQLHAAEDFAEDHEYDHMRVSQLRAQLRAHGLSTVGKKDVLLQRLKNYVQLEEGQDGYRQVPYDVQAEHDHIEDMADAKVIEDAATTADKAAAASLTLPKIAETTNATVDELPQHAVTLSSVPKAQEHTSADELLEEAGYHIPHSSNNNKQQNMPPSNSQTHTHKAANESGDNADNNGKHKPPAHASVPQTTTTNTTTKIDKQLRQGDVMVEYIHGLPHLTVPLPSRAEKCRFALKPVSHHVGDLVEMLKTEDRGIDRATILNKCGVRIASTCNIDSLMDEPFVLQINDTKYNVVPPKREKMDTEDLNKLGDIRSLVAQLYEALHVGEYYIHKEQELESKLENLKYEVSPLEMQKEELSKQAERKTLIVTWVGLGLMSIQFGILARLTWWEYSWDIMEPVTYFVTYGTTMAMYAYYCITKTEYNFPEVRNRQFLLTIHKRAKKKQFDIDKYNSLKRQIAEIEYDLRRLRDPLNLQLPPHVDRSQRGPPATPSSSRPVITPIKCEKKEIKLPGFRLPFLDPKK